MKIATSLRTGFCKLLATGGLLCLAQTSAPAALVGQWVADDWSGGTANWVDRVAGKIATVPTPANSPGKSAGLVFDGVDDYLEVAAAQNPIVGKTSVTIMAFFRTSQGASGADESDDRYPGPLNGELGPNGWGLTYDNAGNARGSFNYYDISPDPDVRLIDGQPHTMILTWQDPTDFQGQGVARLYVDGILAGSTPGPTDFGNGIINQRFIIGSEPDHSRYFNGAISELRFYDSIEDPAALHGEITKLRVVSNTNDSGPGSLRATVAAAAAGDTINFDPALSGQTITLTNGQIALSRNIIINATSLPGGLTLDGGGMNRLFTVLSGQSVALHGLTLTGGAMSSANGGAIFNEGTLSLTQCTLSGNASGQSGGAVFNGGTLTLTRCTLSGNDSTYHGGAIFNGQGSVTLSQCTLAGNTAGGNGGAIGAYQGSLNLAHCTLSGNASTDGAGLDDGHGGAIDNYDGSLALTNTLIAGNTATTEGPDIGRSGPITLGGVNFIGDLASTGLSAGPTLLTGDAQLASLGDYGGPTQTMRPLVGSPAIDGCTSGTSGTSGTSFASDQRGLPRVIGPFADIGAVEFQDATMVTTNADSGDGSLRFATTYTTNGATLTFAPNLSGSTILLTTGQITLNKNLTIDASALPGGIEINGNAASRIFLVASGNTVVLNSLTLTNGYTTDSGGGIWNKGTLTVNRCTLEGNSAVSGGGLFTTSGVCTVNQSTFFGNTAIEVGGAIVSYSTLAVNQCTLNGNSASYAAGTYYSGPLALFNSIVAGNTPDNLYAGGGTLTATGVNLTNGDPMLAPLGNYGGPTQTMPPLAGSPAIDGCTSDTGFTTDQRGFPRITGPFADIGAVEFQLANPMVTTNADSGVGSLRFAATYATNGATLTFASNLSGSTILLTNGPISLNQNLTIDGSALPAGMTLSGNHASRIFEVTSGATVLLDSLTLTGGKSADGGVGVTGAPGTDTQPAGPGGPGGPGVSGGGILNQGTLTLNRVTLSGNAAGNGGKGGDGGSGLAPGRGGKGGDGAVGGAIFNGITGNLTLLNSTIADNASGAGGNGGSGLVSGDAGKGGSGGGIRNEGILNLTHTTITDNVSGAAGSGGGAVPASSGTGGGILNTGTLNLTNTIVALNTAPGGHPDLSGSVTSTGGVNFIGNPSGATGLGVAGVNYLTGDPMLAQLAHYGGPTLTKPPLPGSPIIDATGFGPDTDQRGLERPQGAKDDIGAVEFLPTMVTTAADEDNLDPGSGLSLREALLRPFVSTITFDSTVFNGEPADTILLAHGQLIIARSLIIDASAIMGGVTVSGQNDSRIFAVNPGTTVGLESLTLIDGNSTTGSGIHNSGTLTVNQCTLSDNYSGNTSTYGLGGSIYNSGTLTLQNSTVARNFSTYSGGGMGNTGTLILKNATVFGNTAEGPGGGIHNYDNGTLTLNNSIIAGNTAPNGPDIDSTDAGTMLPPIGVNLLGNTDNSTLTAGSSVRVGDPLLAPLGNYGGRAQTLPPLPGSPAIDASTSGLPTDQRGLSRAKDGDRNGVAHYDIGAVEVGPSYLVNTVIDEFDGVGAGDLSLRDAITDVPPIPDSQENRIFFDPTVFDRQPIPPIFLSPTLVELNITKSLVIDASTVGGVTIVGNNTRRVLSVAAVSARLVALTITAGRSTSDGGGINNNGTLTLEKSTLHGNASTSWGGGIYNNATLIVKNSTLYGNSSTKLGGGIYNNATLMLENSTLSGNVATIHGGGIYNSGFLALKHSTLSANSAGTYGGGVHNFTYGTIAMNNAIVAGNLAPTGPDLNTTTFRGTNLPPTGVSLLGNLANSGLSAGDAVLVGNPLLAPLDYYGRPTKTMPLLPGSPAIDGALLRGDTPALDQRGAPRPSGPRPDIGAVEAFAFSMIPLVDADNDGIDDRLEPAYGLVVGVDNRATDSDGDGSPDGQELFNMTDPTNPSDNFRILSFVPVPESLPAPLAQWVADDWTGGTDHWVDRIGGKIATVATAANSPTKTAGLFPQRGASASSGLVFDGIDDFFSVSATENPLVGKTSVTIAAYFLSTQGASDADSSHWLYPGPLNGASPDYLHDWGLTYNAAGDAQGFFDYPITPSPAVSVIDGQPHSMILTWQDHTVFPGEGLGRLYVDGVLVGQTTVPTGGGDGIANDGFVIGSEPEQLLRYFSGAIGELRFYDSIQDPPAVHAQLMREKSFDLTLRTFPGLGYSLESSSTLSAEFQDVPDSAFFATSPADTLRILLPPAKAFLRAKRNTGE